MKSLGLEITLMFITALLAVGLVEIGSLSAAVEPLPPEITIQEKAQPHQTHPDMLLISFTVYLTQTPTIEEVSLLSAGRVSNPPAGANYLKLITSEGQILYTLSFFTDFVLADGPSHGLNEMSYTYIVPYTEQVLKIALSTPTGEIIYNIPADIKENP